MASHSGIRASGSGTGDYIKKIVLKDAASYGPWRAKLTSILDAEDLWEIVNGAESEPDEIATVEDDSDEDSPDNRAEIVAREIEIKAWRKRAKKAASLITQTVDDSIVMSLDEHNRDPFLMWAQLAADYNTVTPAMQSTARKNFLNFSISDDETYLECKQHFKELLRLVTVQNGTVSVADQLQTLLGALPVKFDSLRESYFAQTPAPNINYIWDRMFDIESNQIRRSAQHEAAGMRAESYFQTRGRGGSTFRGRSRGGNRGGGSGRGEVKSENCFRCGDSDHWSRECPKKDSVCNWCGAVGHIEKTCYSKANGSAKGTKSGSGRGRGSAVSRRGR